MKHKKRKNSKQFKNRFSTRFFSVKTVPVIIFTVFIVVIAVLGSVHTQKKIAGYQETIDELSTELKQLKQTNDALEEERDNLDSDESREKIARDRLGMIGEDEYLLEQSEDNGEETTESAEEKAKGASTTEVTETDDVKESEENGE